MVKLPLEFEFDHVGIAVPSLEEGEKVYLGMGISNGHIEEVKSEKVRVKMFELGNQSRIELLEPTSDDSVISKFLKKHGPGIHHICLRVTNVRASLEQLKKNGFRLIHDTPFRGAHNCEVAFLHPSTAGGVLIELSQPMGEAHEEVP